MGAPSSDSLSETSCESSGERMTGATKSFRPGIPRIQVDIDGDGRHQHNFVG
ncbi:Uncharacterised protein [Mycobacteroides abscessus subsp. abscessus]|nr:Uncharacterised protein [Mycobacteroides abscessus subsp. abscessus]